MILVKVRTAVALGIPNLARVGWYRASVRLGVNRVRSLRAAVPRPPFFLSSLERRPLPAPSTAWRTEARYFGWFPVLLSPGRCPDWHLNPFTGGRADPAKPWWTIPDFDPRVGDIKAVWEASRFDWVLPMAQRAAAGEPGELSRLNAWLSDWCAANPPYSGVNWKCGQEASIRVMHLAMAAVLLGQWAAPAEGLLDLIECHLARIAPTIDYARAQDNNHGTSEAAGLFIGGSWLARCGRARGGRWQEQGRAVLEERVARLIAADGSFSQYSLNYHRVVLDTLSMAEVWRRELGLAAFSPVWRRRAEKAVGWLATLVDPRSGDAPNLGANDGARLVPVADTDFRDFRPSVQLASALFLGRRVYAGDGPWNDPLRWFRVPIPADTGDLGGSRQFEDGGYAVVRHGEAAACLRYPRFIFRPSHADALALELWFGGENLLRDGGTYSYAGDAADLRYFAGTEGHSAIQFDDRDQMPRLGRFLFGDWLSTEQVTPMEASPDGTTAGASYRDRHGARHERRIRLTKERLSVRDDIGGFARKAVLRWRLRPGPWTFDGTTATDGRDTLVLRSSRPPRRSGIVPGWESRYYLQKTPLPVLEFEVDGAAIVETEYIWQGVAGEAA